MARMAIGFEAIVGTGGALLDVETKAAGPAGRLPLTPEMLLEWPSGDVFGWSRTPAWAGTRASWAALSS